MKKLLLTLINLFIIIYANAQTVTTFAGSGLRDSINGTGIASSFNMPTGVAIDASGNLYVADRLNSLIRKITSVGVVTTLAGSGSAGSTNGTGRDASFALPEGVAVDASGTVYVAEAYNNLIRKITSVGVVTTLAGSGTQGIVNGTGTAASFHYPLGVTVDASGNVYVAEYGNNLIRKITSGGVVTTFAGSGTQGNTNGTGTAASFNNPSGVAIDAFGNIFVADYGNNLIRKITSGGIVSTFAGSGTQGSTNGTGTSASFSNPSGIAIDVSGNIYVADQGNNLIRMITSLGVVKTLAGSGASGSINGEGTAASFTNPYGVAVDAYGNVYVADRGNSLIRKITSVTTGVGDQLLDSDALTIYPNPSSDILHIKTTLQVTGFQIMDMTGILVSSGDQVSNKIDISLLKHGIYFIRIKTNKGLALIKFAKQ